MILRELQRYLESSQIPLDQDIPLWFKIGKSLSNVEKVFLVKQEGKLSLELEGGSLAKPQLGRYRPRL